MGELDMLTSNEPLERTSTGPPSLFLPFSARQSGQEEQYREILSKLELILEARKQALDAGNSDLRLDKIQSKLDMLVSASNGQNSTDDSNPPNLCLEYLERSRRLRHM